MENEVSIFKTLPNLQTDYAMENDMRTDCIILTLLGFGQDTKYSLLF